MDAKAKTLRYYFLGLGCDILLLLFGALIREAPFIFYFCVVPHCLVGVMMCFRYRHKSSVSNFDRSLLVFGQTYILGCLMLIVEIIVMVKSI
jgi:hypothetical protein